MNTFWLTVLAGREDGVCSLHQCVLRGMKASLDSSPRWLRRERQWYTHVYWGFIGTKKTPPRPASACLRWVSRTPIQPQETFNFLSGKTSHRKGLQQSFEMLPIQFPSPAFCVKEKGKAGGDSPVCSALLFTLLPLSLLPRARSKTEVGWTSQGFLVQSLVRRFHNPASTRTRWLSFCSENWENLSLFF